MSLSRRFADEDAPTEGSNSGVERFIVIGGVAGVVFGVVALLYGALAALGVLLAGAVGSGLGALLHGVLTGRFDAAGALKAFRRDSSE